MFGQGYLQSWGGVPSPGTGSSSGASRAGTGGGLGNKKHLGTEEKL